MWARDYVEADRTGVVSDFHCGDAEWSREVSDWIAGDGPAEVFRKYGTVTTLYFTDGENALIGFAALGSSEWNHPDKKSPKQALAIIAYLALHTAFHGRTDADGEKYSRILLADIVDRARSQGHKLIGLYVHHKNTPARKLYESAGFQYTSYQRQGDYLRMFAEL